MLNSKKLLGGSIITLLSVVFLTCLIFVVQAENTPKPEKGKPETIGLSVPAPKENAADKEKTETVKPAPEATKTEAAKSEATESEATESEAVPTGFWIGVQVVPVPELFLSHFGVKDETGSLVAVDRVLPDGPAAKAGVKRGDIVLKFGDKEIRSLPDLIEQVSKAKETATNLEVVRDGAKTTLSVTPVPRPDDVQNVPGILNLREMPRMPHLGHRLPPNAFQGGQDPQQMMRQMEEFFRQLQGGADSDDLLIMPPTAQQQKDADNGKQLSVATLTDQSGKTTIKVTQVLKDGEKTDKKTWEVEKVDELPQEIQAEVNMLLGK